MSLEGDRALRELLAFYQEAGIETLIDEMPVDWFAANAAGPNPAPASIAAAPRGAYGRDATVKDGARASAPVPPAGNVTVRSGAGPPPAPEAAIMAARQAARKRSEPR